MVCSALDTKTGKPVAIKRVRHVLSSSKLATCFRRELRILRNVLLHENFVALKDVFLFSGDDAMAVYELMPCDLFHVINSTAPIDHDNIKFLMFQTLRAVNCLHFTGALHCGIKASNVLVDGQCRVKLSGFGLARTVEDTGRSHTLLECASNLAPELLTSKRGDYSAASDMWSCGCLFAELVLRKPLFPGDHRKVLARIKEYASEDPESGKMEKLQSLFPVETDPAMLQLICRMLAFDSGKRLTAKDALLDEYFVEWMEPLGFGPMPSRLALSQVVPADIETSASASASEPLLADIVRDIFHIGHCLTVEELLPKSQPTPVSFDLTFPTSAATLSGYPDADRFPGGPPRALSDNTFSVTQRKVPRGFDGKEF